MGQHSKMAYENIVDRAKTTVDSLALKSPTSAKEDDT